METAQISKREDNFCNLSLRDSIFGYSLPELTVQSILVFCFFKNNATTKYDQCNQVTQSCFLLANQPLKGPGLAGAVLPPACWSNTIPNHPRLWGESTWKPPHPAKNRQQEAQSTKWHKMDILTRWFGQAKARWGHRLGDPEISQF